MDPEKRTRLLSVPRHVLGRKNTVRLSRFLADSGRLDGPNRPELNGEYDLVRRVVQATKPSVTVLDVGAFKGDWTFEVCRVADEIGARVDARVFEALAPSFERIQSRVEREISGHEVTVVNAAVSSTEGHVEFHAVGSDAGTNSVVQVDAGLNARPTEMVSVRATTVDAYCRQNNIDRVDLVKIDTEGHDLEVLRGCQEMLAADKIGAVQFEYNWRWIAARAFLRDVFELLPAQGWQLGKLTGEGVEWYPEWHFELENFRECNMLLLPSDSTVEIDAIRWWRD